MLIWLNAIAINAIKLSLFIFFCMFRLRTTEDLAIALLQFAEKVGPGFLWRTVRRSFKADIILPNDFCARFNMNIGK